MKSLFLSPPLYSSHPLKSAVGMCASFVSQETEQETESQEAGASGRGECEVRGFLFLLQILT